MKMKFKYILLILILIVAVFSYFHKNEKVLRVGTTGDYKPVTWYDTKTETYTGFDIDVAKLIAKKLHMKIIFVRTMWQRLSQDLKDKKFDVAMGGISVTAERKKQFNFSTSVLSDKKVVVIRCSDESKLFSWEMIDQPSVRLIENIGGTNEIFAKKYVTKANLLLSNSNRVVFNKILANEADAMITDRLEANEQHHQHPDLCVLDIPTTISPTSEKAYMLRKDEDALLRSMDEVIQEIKSDKTLDDIKKKWNI